MDESLQYSLERSLPAETLLTIAPDVWTEIARVARLHNCETVLLGLPRVKGPGIGARLDGLIAGLIASLSWSGKRSLTFFGIFPGSATSDTRRRIEHDLGTLTANEVTGECEVVVDTADLPIDGIVRDAREADLIILGMHRSDRTARTLGGLLLDLSRQTDVPIVGIGERPRRGPGFGPWRLPG